jgi:hypothetical protein
MVLYFKLSERRLAFPRAEEHLTARNMLPDSAKRICTLPDGTILNGWVLNEKESKTLLYFPDNSEDAATFLAEIRSVKNVRLVSFNYRGSAGNKGKPEGDKFESDAHSIWECAADGQKMILAGRGTGSILALNLSQEKTTDKVILIDPTPSIAAKISDKYRLLFPEFLVHTKIAMKNRVTSPPDGIIILEDKKEKRNLTKMTKNKFLTSAKITDCKGKTLAAALTSLIRL